MNLLLTLAFGTSNKIKTICKRKMHIFTLCISLLYTSQIFKRQHQDVSCLVLCWGQVTRKEQTDKYSKRVEVDVILPSNAL